MLFRDVSWLTVFLLLRFKYENIVYVRDGFFPLFFAITASVIYVFHLFAFKGLKVISQLK